MLIDYEAEQCILLNKITNTPIRFDSRKWRAFFIIFNWRKKECT